jgi:hypothetical protein
VVVWLDQNTLASSMEFNRVKNFQGVKKQKTNIDKINFAHYAATPVATKTSTSPLT